MGAGLLSGLGRAIENTGNVWMNDQMQRWRDERLNEYAKMERQEERELTQSQTATNIGYETDAEGNQVKVSTNAAGDVIQREEMRSGDKGYQLSNGIILDKSTGDYVQVPGWDGESPSAVQEYKFFEGLSPEKQAEFLKVKRAVPVKDFGGYIGAVNPNTMDVTNVGSKTLSPEKELDYISGAEGAKLAGRGEQTEIDKQTSARSRVQGVLDTMKGLYDNLNEKGGIVNTDKNPLDNVGASIASSGVGQFAGKVVGTEEQSIRNQINQMLPTLLNEIRQATNMGAKGLDSEKELQFYVQAASDPKRDLQSNLEALNVLSKAYGLTGYEPPSIGRNMNFQPDPMSNNPAPQPKVMNWSDM